MTDGRENECSETARSDIILALVRGTVGLTPFVGSLLAELVGVVIPDRRVERLRDLVTKFGERVANLEDVTNEQLETRFSDEYFGDFMETALREAASSVSEERRSYIANMISNGLSQQQIRDIERKHLMKMLADLNDVEVLWLRFYLNPTIGGDAEFRDAHEDVFRVHQPSHDASREDMDRYALSESYKGHLVRLGLLEEEIDRGGHEKRKITGLGRLMLREIGLVEGE